MADEAKQKAEEPTYHVDRLIAESGDFLGQPPHVVAGALSGKAKKNFTLDEAKGLIDKWLKHEVEFDNVPTEEA